MSANDEQVGGGHYKDKPIEVWDFIHYNGLGYLAGNAIKYLARYKDKNGVEDLQKARHYVDKLIEVETEAARRESFNRVMSPEEERDYGPGRGYVDQG